ncbi:MAG: hypothetical protein WC627_11130 [Legionella sp.]|jgi:hypothetical protein
MAKINELHVLKINRIALEFKQNPANTAGVMQNLPKILSDQARAEDLYSIYYNLCRAFESDEDELDHVQNKFLIFVKNPRFLYFTIEDQHALTPHQFITVSFFMKLMANGSDEANTQIECNNIVKTLQNHTNGIFDTNGNTPIFWGIANSNILILNQMLDAINTNINLIEKHTLDTHCKNYHKGSALFFACLKGENHSKNVLQRNALTLESSIIKLIEYGASPTDKCETGNQYSPLEIMVLRKNPDIVQLMLDHLDTPLNEEEILRLQTLAATSYAEMETIIIIHSDGICTLPDKDNWEQNSQKIDSIISQLPANRNQNTIKI